MKYYFLKYKESDQRSNIVNNSIVGIKSVKFNAWEDIIRRKIDKNRLREKTLIFISAVINSIVDGYLFLLPMFTALICIVIYQKVYDDLTLGETFFIINMFNLFATPLRVMFFAIANVG